MSLRDILEKQKAETEQKQNPPGPNPTPLTSLVVKKEEVKPPEKIEPIAEPPKVPTNGLAALRAVAAKAPIATPAASSTQTRATVIPKTAIVAKVVPVQKATMAAKVEALNAPQPEGAPVVPVDVEKLKQNLEYLAANIEQKDLVGQVVRTIAIQLKENPELESHMNDGDFNLIIRGLRRAFNVAARNKSEKRETRNKKEEAVDELAGIFGDLGLKL